MVAIDVRVVVDDGQISRYPYRLSEFCRHHACLIQLQEFNTAAVIQAVEGILCNTSGSNGYWGGHGAVVLKWQANVIEIKTV